MTIVINGARLYQSHCQGVTRHPIAFFLSQSPILCRDRAFIRFLAAIKLYIHLTFSLTSNIPVSDLIQRFFSFLYGNIVRYLDYGLI